MALSSLEKETELAETLIKTTEDVEYICLLKTYANKIEESSFPSENFDLRKKVCSFLQTQLTRSKSNKTKYETLKLLLKFSRNVKLAQFCSQTGILDDLIQLCDLPDDGSDLPVNLFAWKCISNVVYLTKDKKGLCGNKDFLKRLMNQLFHEEKRTHEERIQLLKIFYLVTALNKQGRSYLAEDCNCRRLLLNQLQKSFTKDRELSEEEISISIEVLKDLFNAVMDLRSTNIRTQQTVEEIKDLLQICHEILSKKIDDDLSREQLYRYAGNAVYSVSPQDFEIDYFLPMLCEDQKNFDKKANISQTRDIVPLLALLEIMSKYLKSNTSIADIVLPIVALFGQMSKFNSGVRRYLKQLLLPPRRDFKKRPEEGDQVSNKLIQLLTSVNPSVKMTVADFLFVLCKENADKFVKHTGYGNAAGLLASRGLLAGGRGEGVYSDSDTDSDSEEYKAVADEIDPVTGHIHEARPNPMDGMSDEQKEYLAVKLANEISKLSSNSPIQPMCVGEDGKLISMTEKFHQMKTEDEEENSD